MHCHKLLLFSLLLTACAIFCADAATVALAPADGTVTTAPSALPEVVTDDTKKKTTTTTSTTTTTTTTAAPITTTTTTTTTPKPETTTPSTTTTTAPTTTSTSTTTTTTPEPITTTTPKPGPYPDPKIGVWNSTCIKVQMAAQLNFTYITKDNKTATALYNVPDTAAVDHAICNPNTTQSIQINWGPADYQHSMMLHFTRDNNTVNMTTLYFSLPLTKEDFPNAAENQTVQLVHVKPEFNMPIKMSYHCTRQQKLILNETIGANSTGSVNIQDLQLQAYRTDNSTAGFSAAQDCDSANTSDVVPIAVGLALVALILIVLVAYLCARRRSNLRGYMSF